MINKILHTVSFLKLQALSISQMVQSWHINVFETILKYHKQGFVCVFLLQREVALNTRRFYSTVFQAAGS